MYEFEVLLKNGERTFIWGYNLHDAASRSFLSEEGIIVLSQNYID